MGLIHRVVVSARLSSMKRTRRKIGGRQAQPDVAVFTATSATVVRTPSAVIFAIFRKRTFFVTFIGVSFVGSCRSS